MINSSQRWHLISYIFNTGTQLSHNTAPETQEKNYEDHFGHSLKLYYKWSKSDLNLLSKSTFFDSLQYWCKFHYSIHLKNEIENGKRWSHPQGEQLDRLVLQ